MPSVMFNNGSRRNVIGQVEFGEDVFYAMLMTNAYVPNADVQQVRSDIIAQEVTGSGYVEGGKIINKVIPAYNPSDDTTDVLFGPITWTGLTVTGARFLVVYKRRGGAPSADELVYAQDFGSDVTLAAGTLTVEEVIYRTKLVQPT